MSPTLTNSAPRALLSSARRSNPPSTSHNRSTALLALLLLLVAVLTPVARAHPSDKRAPRPLLPPGLLLDLDVAPWQDARNPLYRRQLDPLDDASTKTTTTTSSVKSTTASTLQTSSRPSASSAPPSPTSRFATTDATAFPSSTTSSGLMVASDTPQASLPQPFDTSLGNNFTNPSCPQFFNSFLNDPTFTSCVPLSLLLMNSQSFFQTQQDSKTLHRVLDATCSVVSAACANAMDGFANAIKAPQNCGGDFAAQNPVVLRAYNGFIAYRPMYAAGCLKVKDAGAYCFEAASINTSAPADQYLYYIPLGVPLPGSSRPSCSSCVQQTMQIFAQAATNLSTPLAGDYGSAATQINSKCGPNWVNASVQPIQGSGGGGSTSGASRQATLWSVAGIAAAAAAIVLA